VDGHWSEVAVREGGAWKIRLLTLTPNTEPKAAIPNIEVNSTIANPESAGADSATVIIKIDKTNQKMTVFLDGVETYDWPVSTGKQGYSTPTGTYTATSMNEIWYSKQWDNAPMPHSIFFMKDGHAIHGSFDVKDLGKPVSHGCVRISPENAATLYALVAQNGLESTHVVLTGITPGGEFKSVRGQAEFGRGRGGAKAQASHGWGFFGRSFGAPYYNRRLTPDPSGPIHAGDGDRRGAPLARRGHAWAGSPQVKGAMLPVGFVVAIDGIGTDV
jgi:hypothetical protein